MNEELTRKLLRNVRFLNAFLVIFLIVFLAVFTVAGVFAYRAAQEVGQARDSLNDLQTRAEDSLNFRSELCDSSGSVSTLLKNQSDVCSE